MVVFEQIKNLEPALIRGLFLEQPPQVVNLLCRVPSRNPSPTESATVRSIREVCRDANFRREHQRAYPRAYRMRFAEVNEVTSAPMILSSSEFALSYRSIPSSTTQSIAVFDLFDVSSQREGSVVGFSPVMLLNYVPKLPPIGKVLGNFPNSHRFLCVGENLTAVVYDPGTDVVRALLQTTPFPPDLSQLRMWAIGGGDADKFVVKDGNTGEFYVSDGRTVQHAPFLFTSGELHDRFGVHMQDYILAGTSLSVVSSLSGTHVYMMGFARTLHRWTLDFSALRFMRYDGIVDAFSTSIIHDSVPVPLTMRSKDGVAHHMVLDLGESASAVLIRQPRDPRNEIGYYFEDVETEPGVPKEVFYYRSEDFRKDLGTRVVTLASGATMKIANTPRAYSPDATTGRLLGMSAEGSELLVSLPALDANDAAISRSLTPDGGDALVMIIPQFTASLFSGLLHMRPVLVHLKISDTFRVEFFDAPRSLLEFMTVEPPEDADLLTSIVLAPGANRYFVMQSRDGPIDVYAGRLLDPV